jgi:hypothetical protein
MESSEVNGKRTISESEIRRIVDQQLPHWRAACDHVGADTVYLNQRAFGLSDKELLLLAVAIKYAGIAKKNVTISPD